MFETFIRALEFFGIISFALSGIVEARKEKFDFIGVYIVALITAFGGGTLRDLLIDRSPLFWIQHDWYLAIIFVLTLISCIKSIDDYPRLILKAAIIFDAAGIGLFSVVGAGYTLNAGFGVLSALALGGITAIFGGVFRDVICNRLPYVFQKTELCVTCAVLGSALYILCLRVLGLPDQMCLILGALLGGSLRWFAVEKNVKLPL